MNHLLLAPHNDDEALFASFTILRLKPHILVITDGAKHEARFGKERGIVVRRKESEEAMKVLGVEVDFLGIPDTSLYLDNLIVNLEDYGVPEGKVFAPASQGSHADHETVSEAAARVFGDKVIYYSTYSRNDLTPRGQFPIYGTEEEHKLKKEALGCYKSQLDINKPHFDAVWDKPEYLNFDR